MANMWEQIKNKLIELKKSKYFFVITAIVLIIILLCVYIVYSQEEEPQTGSQLEDQKAITEIMEERLSLIIKDIDGVGEASVLISYASTAEVVYESMASDSLFSDKELVAVKENLPDILGVLVVAEGADTIKTKVNIVNAVMTALSISADKIQVFAK